jgi:hypothetical protein
LKGTISMPIYLYIKTHKITGLNYLGKTTQNPFTYPGSGLHWKRHLQKHGNHVHTTVLQECTTNEEISRWGIYYSGLFNIVESKEWANLKPESGDGGSRPGRIHSDDAKLKNKIASTGHIVTNKTREKIRKSLTGQKRTFSDVHKKHLSESKKGKTNSLKGKLQPKITCPHCNLSGGASGMKRYHFNNCRKKLT